MPVRRPAHLLPKLASVEVLFISAASPPRELPNQNHTAITGFQCPLESEVCKGTRCKMVRTSDSGLLQQKSPGRTRGFWPIDARGRAKLSEKAGTEIQAVGRKEHRDEQSGGTKYCDGLEYFCLDVST
jgi:hypothetical protein